MLRPVALFSSGGGEAGGDNSAGVPMIGKGSPDFFLSPTCGGRASSAIERLLNSSEDPESPTTVLCFPVQLLSRARLARAASFLNKRSFSSFKSFSCKTSDVFTLATRDDPGTPAGIEPAMMDLMSGGGRTFGGCGCACPSARATAWTARTSRGRTMAGCAPNPFASQSLGSVVERKASAPETAPPLVVARSFAVAKIPRVSRRAESVGRGVP